MLKCQHCIEILLWYMSSVSNRFAVSRSKPKPLIYKDKVVDLILESVIDVNDQVEVADAASLSQMIFKGMKLLVKNWPGTKHPTPNTNGKNGKSSCLWMANWFLIWRIQP